MTFIYCSYWGTWSRVLSHSYRAFGYGPYVEVDLTPILNSYQTWDHVKRINIRAHGTTMGKNDKITSELPSEVKQKMIENLGAELTERLLTEDFLPQIDWALYAKKCNGGAAFADIKQTG